MESEIISAFFVTMNQTSEDIIIRNLKDNDRSAFRILFSKYYQPLFLFAQKFVSEDLAKDFVQDCFFDLWQNRKKIDIRSSVSAYLFTIVKNRCYKHFQKEQIKWGKDHNVNFLLKQQELNYFLNSEKSILEFDTRDRIEKTFNQLPGKCCEVFKESRLNGWSNKEIAEKFQISIKAVEKHISKALKVFRAEFKDIVGFLLIALIRIF